MCITSQKRRYSFCCMFLKLCSGCIAEHAEPRALLKTCHLHTCHMQRQVATCRGFWSLAEPLNVRKNEVLKRSSFCRWGTFSEANPKQSPTTGPCNCSAAKSVSPQHKVCFFWMLSPEEVLFQIPKSVSFISLFYKISGSIFGPRKSFPSGRLCLRSLAGLLRTLIFFKILIYNMDNMAHLHTANPCH